MSQATRFDAIVIGAGAAGLMCAMSAGRRGRSVLLIDHAEKAGKKILISGGGRCNFTNLHTAPDRFVSANRHFAISALKRYTQHDFIALVRRHGIAYHEKKLGQLFCDDSARDIVGMLLRECDEAGVRLALETPVTRIARDGLFRVETSRGPFESESLVIATGGLSIPKMGATGFGYRIAEQFGLKVLPTRAGLVPFTFAEADPRNFKDLAGVSCEASVRCGGTAFDEAILFTHRGISGPAILQISSYWRDGDTVEIDMLPGLDAAEHLKRLAAERPKAEVKTVLSEVLPRRLAHRVTPAGLDGRPAGQVREREWSGLAEDLRHWRITPAGTEGYRTAEVTLGGVDTSELSSKTLEARRVPGLFFIGEVVDVTGWLGGYNFQWAWSSGYCAGQFA
ncbi:NAD(P)/FAD-dependent oxidoreductase [Skermanella sp. TT6]|uniref:NAD(P)/FAD-dependent oxidoreductase n=1 Tax=Skermanella cutis TaxID=2775420 RepID=A0ABX7B020_9PROT|nr:NAD(P)/FAD-dependent oxidoreductase [Skermanella sp. TT6]QQP87673.1 NAD(P)/FAD-dependent oxidoreductase [Skermanella sp. TT6]